MYFQSVNCFHSVIYVNILPPYVLVLTIGNIPNFIHPFMSRTPYPSVPLKHPIHSRGSSVYIVYQVFATSKFHYMLHLPTPSFISWARDSGWLHGDTRATKVAYRPSTGQLGSMMDRYRDPVFFAASSYRADVDRNIVLSEMLSWPWRFRRFTNYLMEIEHYCISHEMIAQF